MFSFLFPFFFFSMSTNTESLEVEHAVFHSLPDTDKAEEEGLKTCHNKNEKKEKGTCDSTGEGNNAVHCASPRSPHRAFCQSSSPRELSSSTSLGFSLFENDKEVFFPSTEETNSKERPLETFPIIQMWESVNMKSDATASSEANVKEEDKAQETNAEDPQSSASFSAFLALTLSETMTSTHLRNVDDFNPVHSVTPTNASRDSSDQNCTRTEESDPIPLARDEVEKTSSISSRISHPSVPSKDCHFPPATCTPTTISSNGSNENSCTSSNAAPSVSLQVTHSSESTVNTDFPEAAAAHPDLLSKKILKEDFSSPLQLSAIEVPNHTPSSDSGTDQVHVSNATTPSRNSPEMSRAKTKNGLPDTTITYDPSIPHTEEKIIFVRHCVSSIMDIHLCYQCFGTYISPECTPVLLLVCGLNMQLFAWDEAFCEDLVRAGFFVIRYDNRDSGYSTKVERGNVKGYLLLLPSSLASALGERIPYTLEDMAKDGISLLDALHIPRAHVMGISMGGMIAQLMALIAPSRFVTLTSIMSSTNAKDLPDAQLQVKLWMLRKPPAGCSLDALLNFRVHALLKVLPRTLSVDSYYLKKRFLISLQRSRYTDGLIRQACAILRCSPRDDLLRQLNIPALVIHGTQDLIVPPMHGWRTAEVLPHARLLVLKHMGHHFHPAFYQTVILTFAAMASATPCAPSVAPTTAMWKGERPHDDNSSLNRRTPMSEEENGNVSHVKKTPVGTESNTPIAFAYRNDRTPSLSSSSSSPPGESTTISISPEMKKTDTIISATAEPFSSASLNHTSAINAAAETREKGESIETRIDPTSTPFSRGTNLSTTEEEDRESSASSPTFIVSHPSPLFPTSLMFRAPLSAVLLSGDAETVEAVSEGSKGTEEEANETMKSSLFLENDQASRTEEEEGGERATDEEIQTSDEVERNENSNEEELILRHSALYPVVVDLHSRCGAEVRKSVALAVPIPHSSNTPEAALVDLHELPSIHSEIPAAAFNHAKKMQVCRGEATLSSLPISLPSPSERKENKCEGENRTVTREIHLDPTVKDCHESSRLSQHTNRNDVGHGGVHEESKDSTLSSSLQMKDEISENQEKKGALPKRGSNAALGAEQNNKEKTVTEESSGAATDSSRGGSDGERPQRNRFSRFSRADGVKPFRYQDRSVWHTASRTAAAHMSQKETPGVISTPFPTKSTDAVASIPGNDSEKKWSDQNKFSRPQEGNEKEDPEKNLTLHNPYASPTSLPCRSELDGTVSTSMETSWDSSEQKEKKTSPPEASSTMEGSSAKRSDNQRSINPIGISAKKFFDSWKNFFK